MLVKQNTRTNQRPAILNAEDVTRLIARGRRILQVGICYFETNCNFAKCICLPAATPSTHRRQLSGAGSESLCAQRAFLLSCVDLRRQATFSKRMECCLQGSLCRKQE